MLAKCRFWAVINVYALLLDVIALLMFWAAFRLVGSGLALCIILAFVGAFLLYGALGIHGTYAEKRRIYGILLRKNAREFHIDSFKDFMGVPCHRVVVMMVLGKLGKRSAYGEIKRKYYRYPWQSRFDDTTILHIFQSKGEGKPWR